MERTVTRGAQLTAGLAGGLAGAFLMEAVFRGALWAVKIAGDQLPLLAEYVGTVLPPGSGPGIAAGIAFLLYLAVSVGWGLGYVGASRTSPQLVGRPWISGAVFGLVVYIVMQVMLLTAGLYHRPNFDVLLVQLAAYIVGFGIPVAVVASRLIATSTRSG